MTRAIYVYADWEGLPTASRLATVRTNKRSAGGELFELEFDPAALASTGASYLELARVLIEHGANPSADLRELWTRIVFNMLVSNSDDHLRNHGFLLVPGKGWRLSPAYDMNPVPDAHGLKLNVSEADNALDLALAREVAPYFRVKPRASDEIIERCRSVVRQWPKLAKHLGISAREQAWMAPAFSRSADQRVTHVRQRGEREVGPPPHAGTLRATSRRRSREHSRSQTRGLARQQSGR